MGITWTRLCGERGLQNRAVVPSVVLQLQYIATVHLHLNINYDLIFALAQSMKENTILETLKISNYALVAFTYSVNDSDDFITYRKSQSQVFSHPFINLLL